ncbi:MAG: PIG-L deacetylase family protein [Candidatus Binatia bacterium]
MNLPERILFVGAHCDDIELFGGGLLARACFAGRRVGVLVFSDHRGVLDEAAAVRARAEFVDNLTWLRAESGTDVHDYSGQMLPACHGAFQSERDALYAAMEALRDDYDLVVTHVPTDTNQDHRQVAEEATRVFKAHTTLLGGEFPNNDLGGFTPHVYVALSPREVDAKTRMVAHYRSQDFGGRPYLDGDLVRALARLRGSQIREAAAEAFAIVGRVVVRVPR